MSKLASIGSKAAGAVQRLLSKLPGRQAWARMPALVGLGLAVLLPASAMQNETLAPALVAPAPAPEQAARAEDAPLLASAEPEIVAVAGALAKRYRVSEDAIRDLVGTAYGEGRRVGVDPLLILAVMAVESRFNPIAQSEFGAVGLMQVIPRYHGEHVEAGHGVSVLDPRVNIELGAKVLKEYIRRGGTETAGLQLYNGASGDSTASYANKVLVERQRLLDAVRRYRAANHA